MGEIPTEMVDRLYEMNPDEDDLLYNGQGLRNGMIVIAASMRLKVDLHPKGWLGTERKLQPVEIFQARQENRWFRISDIEILDKDGIFWYMATYADGVKRKRSAHMMDAWFVKIHSMRDIYPPDPKHI